MKLLLLLSVAMSAVTATADSFTIIRDGREYLCEQTNSPVDPGGGLDCRNRAYAGPFTREESERLCSGARNTAPADCGIKAYNGPFTRDESISLCVGARTIGPADCAVKAYNGPFTRDEAISLCSGNSSVANADCAIRAYQGPYTREEAIRMCKANPLLVLRSLELLAQSADLRPKIESIKSKLQQSAQK
ncbi:MAG: hypothetical protein K0R29_888 [Pseudobdellovibrio sp.]|jgi:hypothetical protein|nr:hypothetical protein [Pseudobdellovibrio sp.]